MFGDSEHLLQKYISYMMGKLFLDRFFLDFPGWETLELLGTCIALFLPLDDEGIFPPKINVQLDRYTPQVTVYMCASIYSQNI